MYNYVDQFNNDLKINKKHTKLINKIKKKKVLLFVSNIHARKKPIVFLKILRTAVFLFSMFLTRYDFEELP